MQTNHDVIIVGSGIVGLTLAAVLASQSLRVAIITQAMPANAAISNTFDLRVSAITRASQQIFQALTLWPRLQALRISPYTAMQVWDSSGAGSIHFKAAEIGELALGHIIENSIMQQALVEQLQQRATVSWYVGIPQHILQQADSIAIQLADGKTLKGQLMVGADGANSWVREQLSLGLTSWDYGHTALVATLHCEQPHLKTARQCFTAEGPLAFLPLADSHVCSIVWSVPPAKAAVLQQLPVDDFNLAVTQAFEYRLGAARLQSERVSFPLKMRHAQQYVQTRCALIGDAAHTIHPLAGQGVNLGLLDAVCLADVVLAARQRKRDIGNLAVLSRYQRQRKGHNVQMIAAMEAFKRMFAAQIAPVRWLRNQGLLLADRVLPLKRYCMEEAMGLHAPLPEFITDAQDHTLIPVDP